MRAQILAAGITQRHQSFFDASRDFLSAQLQSLGVTMEEPLAVAGDPGPLFAAVEAAASRAELVLILTAPQPDAMDAVNQVVAQGLGLPLELREQELDSLWDHTRRSHPGLDRQQLLPFATVPHGAASLGGSGLVRGYALAARRQLLLVLPLSPSELSQLYRGKLEALLTQQLVGAPAAAQPPAAPSSPVVTATAAPPPPSAGGQALAVLKAVGLGEPSIPGLLRDLPPIPQLQLDYTQAAGDWTIRLTARGATQAEAQARCQQGVRLVQEALGAACYSDCDQTPAQALVRRLQEVRTRVTLADGCCAGLPEALLADAPGAAKVLAVIPAQTDKAKLQQLGVTQTLLDRHGGASRQAAVAMAVGARKLGGTQLGAAITGNLTPTQEHPGGLVYLAVTDGDQVWIKTLTLPGQQPDLPRDAIRSISCLQVFHMLQLYVGHQPGLLPGGIPLSSRGRSGLGIKEYFDGKELPFMSLFSKPSRKATPRGSSPTRSGGGTRTGGAARGSSSPRAGAPGPGTPQRGGAAAKPQSKNLIQKIRAGDMDRTDWMRLGVVLLCLAIFLISIVYIISVKMESVRYAKWAESMADSFYNPNISREDADGYPVEYQDKFVSLWMMNEDVAGWVNIPDTTVDYVVVQSTDNVYYERIDFQHNSNQHGVPFVDYRTDQHKPSTNTIIYGHNMNDGQIFGSLLGYKSLAYYKEHPLINYDTVYEDGQYKIFGVVLCKKDDPTFNYHNFIEKDKLTNTGASSMADYISKIRERSLINTKVDVNENDLLLTLSTCDYSFKSNEGDRIARFVIFARKVRPDESPTVDTAGATLNPTPVLPQEWYAAIEKAREAELKKQQEAQATSDATNQWLTESERGSLSADEKKTLAEQRKSDAATYLTYDEQQLGLEEMLATISARKSEFTKWLTSDERKSGSLTTKLNLIDERRAAARQLLTQEEISAARGWAEIEALINQRKNQQNTALVEYAAGFPQWLTAADVQAGSTQESLDALMAQRKQKAQASGVDPNLYGSWADIQNAITLMPYVTQNPRWLAQGDLKSGATRESLDALMAQRQQQAADLGLKPNDYRTWAELQAAIAAAQGNAALQKLVSDNPRLLAQSDIKSGATQDSLKALMEQRRKQATDLGLNVNSYSTWAELQAAITAAQGSAALQKLVTDNPRWLESADLTGASEASLRALMAQRQQQATAAGVNPSQYSTWSQIRAAIASAGQSDPSSGSGSSGSGSGSGSSGSGSGSSGSGSSDSGGSSSGSSSEPDTSDPGSGSSSGGEEESSSGPQDAAPSSGGSSSDGEAS